LFAQGSLALEHHYSVIEEEKYPFIMGKLNCSRAFSDLTGSGKCANLLFDRIFTSAGSLAAFAENALKEIRNCARFY
jgi:hypothetical protein